MTRIYIVVLVFVFTTSVWAKSEEEGKCPCSTHACETTWVQTLGQASAFLVLWNSFETKFPFIARLREVAITQGVTYSLALARTVPLLKRVLGSSPTKEE